MKSTSFPLHIVPFAPGRRVMFPATIYVGQIIAVVAIVVAVNWGATQWTAAAVGYQTGLSRSAIKAFFNIMAKWDVRDDDAKVLLGGVSNGQFYDMKKNPERTLDADMLTRISYLVGIFKALNILYSDKLADAWVKRPNTNRIFGGHMPLAYMMTGGLPAMQIVRRLADARRDGM